MTKAEDKELMCAYAQAALAALECGTIDHLLPEFIGAYNRRVRVIRIAAIATNKTTAYLGQRIRFVANLKPAELAGMFATITGIKDDCVVARITTTRQNGKYQPGMSVRVPFSTYEVEE